jgi:hypothetical protein
MRMQLVTAHLSPPEHADATAPGTEPVTLYMMVPVECEDADRARERDPGEEGSEAIRDLMAEIFDGLEELTDLTVVSEFDGP